MAIALDAAREPEPLAQRPFYSVSEAAALLGVSRVTVWRWIRSGRLSPSRIGHRTVRLRQDDLLGLVDGSSLPEPQLPTSARGHFVMFYEADAYLVRSVAEFLLGALRRNQPALVVATPAHREAIAERLQVSGIDLDAARQHGLLVEHDATETLDRLMVGSQPDPARFEATVGKIVSRLGREGLGGRPRGRRIYGEMVALLVERGYPDAAIALENLWNNLQKKHPFALLCAYPMQQMAGDGLTSMLENACAAHTAVMPTEGYSQLETGDARMREIVALQQKAASLEQALCAERAARDQAEAALHVRDEFISIASHELRTPISVLTAQAQLSLRRLARQGQLEPERVSSALQLVVDQADKLARLVGQLLDVSRLDAGKLSLEPEIVDLAQLVEQIVSTTRPLSAQHQLELTAPPTLRCEIDPLRMEQVLTNLLDNAIKYSPDGGSIEVALSETNDTFELCVRDHGLGIPEDKRGQIFERFYQAHANGQRGMGIGLYVSRQIVELHGGSMHAEFPADGGTRIVVRVPLGPTSRHELALQLASA